jgi:hypothetical protein
MYSPIVRLNKGTPLEKERPGLGDVNWHRVSDATGTKGIKLRIVTVIPYPFEYDRPFPSSKIFAKSQNATTVVI